MERGFFEAWRAGFPDGRFKKKSTFVLANGLKKLYE